MSVHCQPDVYGGGTNTALNHSNFDSRDNLNYSFISPYATNSIICRPVGRLEILTACPLRARSPLT